MLNLEALMVKEKLNFRKKDLAINSHILRQTVFRHLLSGLVFLENNVHTREKDNGSCKGRTGNNQY